MSTAVKTAKESSAITGPAVPRSTARYLELGLVIALGFSIAWQAMFAGQFLSGNASALRLHEFGAYAVVLIALAAFVVEIISGRRMRRWGIAWLAGLLLVAIVAQLLLGFTSVRHAQAIAYHVPLGVSIAGLYVYYLTVCLRRSSGKSH